MARRRVGGIHKIPPWWAHTSWVVTDHVPPHGQEQQPTAPVEENPASCNTKSPWLSLGAVSIRSGPAGGRGGELIANSFTTSLIEAGISVSSDPPHAAKMPLTQGGLQVI